MNAHTHASCCASACRIVDVVHVFVGCCARVCGMLYTCLSHVVVHGQAHATQVHTKHPSSACPHARTHGRVRPEQCRGHDHWAHTTGYQQGCPQGAGKDWWQDHAPTPVLLGRHTIKALGGRRAPDQKESSTHCIESCTHCNAAPRRDQICTSDPAALPSHLADAG